MLCGLDPDTNYFTDADLSILGADAALYDAYARDVLSRGVGRRIEENVLIPRFLGQKIYTSGKKC
ncbi:MAG: hypothetical protein BGO55_26850 [Sphingobacteriales bacterium 50-39]|nr:hypothetical protein [Sphingobacteriales bacterium]OJW56508.1 MAG: hypothetical protein BGO55_26850 [Sphingobacteriales bacterium 50-39]